jgi:protein-disulfide isomerase
MSEPTPPDREPAAEPPNPDAGEQPAAPLPAAEGPATSTDPAPAPGPGGPGEVAEGAAPTAATEPVGPGSPGEVAEGAAPAADTEPGTPGEIAEGATPADATEPGEATEVAASTAATEPGEASEGSVPVEPVVPGATVPVRRPAAILGYVGAVILGVVIGAGALAVASGGIGGASPSPSPAPSPSASPAGNAVGSPDAPVTIEVWADYQCPYCRLEDLLFGGALEREYVTPGVARIVYRDFAFLGQESTDAAVAARCAGAQEPAAQLRYHDALYTFQQGENQGRFARANLLQIAEIVGVADKTAFGACLDDPAIKQAVADETAAGRNVGVSSTPTLRLRGPGGERVLTGFSQTWPPLRDAVEAVRVAPAASPSPGGSGSPAGSPSPGGSAVPSGAGSAAPSSSPVVTPTPGPSGSVSP